MVLRNRTIALTVALLTVPVMHADVTKALPVTIPSMSIPSMSFTLPTTQAEVSAYLPSSATLSLWATKAKGFACQNTREIGVLAIRLAVIVAACKGIQYIATHTESGKYFAEKTGTKKLFACSDAAKESENSLNPLQKKLYAGEALAGLIKKRQAEHDKRLSKEREEYAKAHQQTPDTSSSSSTPTSKPEFKEESFTPPTAEDVNKLSDEEFCEIVLLGKQK